MKAFARRLRKNSTDTERLLWRHLRGRQIEGCKFRRQYVIHGFIADFACVEKSLIVELDGGQHSEHISADENRTRVLENEGFTVVRFWNNEVFEDLDGVLETIRRHLVAK